MHMFTFGSLMLSSADYMKVGGSIVRGGDAEWSQARHGLNQ